MATVFHRSRGRAASLVAAASVVLTSVTVPTAVAANDDPSDLAEACDGAPSANSQFTDYNSLNGRERDVVDCLASGYKGDRNDSDFVLQGSGGRVSFDTSISRAQFAAILNRVADYLGVAPEQGDPNNPTFADVAPGTFFFGEIEELFARGLTNGAGSDTNDVDNDGNTTELIYNPGGQVSYAQIIAFVERLLTDGAGYTLPTGQSHNESNLDCGFFAPEHDALDAAGFLRDFNTPNDCRIDSPRGLVFDLISVGLDHAVETGKAENPFGDPPGSVALAADKTAVSTAEQINLTITVLDVDDEPVNNARVEVFAVATGDAFDAQGNPKDPGNASIAGGGKFGTGATSGVLDGGDPTTNAQGQLTTSLTTTSPSGKSYDVYAFIGDIGDKWTDVKDSNGSTSPKVTVTFTAIPTDLVITTSAEGNAVPYGSSIVVTVQAVDSGGQPIQQSGIPIAFELFRNTDGGGEVLFSRTSGTTNDSGIATWSSPSAQDPQPSSEGNETIDRFTASHDQNNDGMVNDSVTASESESVQWLDLPSDQPQVASIVLENENSAKGDLMGALIANGPQKIVVTVTDVYGKKAVGVGVRLYVGGAPSTFADTNAVGQVEFTPAPPANPAGVNYTAVIDENDSGTYVVAPGGDFNATSATGDTDVTIRWTNPGPTAGTTSYQDLSIAGLSAADLHGFGTVTPAGVNLLFDGNDEYYLGSDATPCITHPEATTSREQFFSALSNDLAANDLVDVCYQPGGISYWVLAVNADGGGSPLP